MGSRSKPAVGPYSHVASRRRARTRTKGFFLRGVVECGGLLRMRLARYPSQSVNGRMRGIVYLRTIASGRFPATWVTGGYLPPMEILWLA